ncbi:twin-arginine translocase TatA/TatE family subunit [Corynebacterium yudongzhengii]|uniref:Sec-independent protein translocase protein TatA n=1 Tax=Corynebacterium yudongzhengii TaxID=2080740 RepID=A0A2U1T8T8_9CORY|nr:Sec-independent protein translocase subunit TatA [Corynebacterium yudongzhengii]AWB81906.1 twin-arginine translocase TatA/TatE family subunit [Corynebacterium yudongzhengii]PWC02298.1 twin-arginine translocase TatA/TatE family subunit [Corynebacterium yudongzhengii]
MSIGFAEIAIIVLVIVLLFGAKKLPELARSVGRSGRIFKSEMREMKNEDGKGADQNQAAQQEQDFWDREENQPRPIEQQPQQSNQQVPWQQQPNQQQNPPQNQ